MASTMNRRTFLRSALISGSLLAVQPSLLLRGASARTSIARWSDPRTWGGSIPGKDDVAIITKPVLLDINATVAGVDVRRGGRLIFHPDKSVSLSSSGNVVVKGSFVMKPSSPRKKHRLTFVGVDESRYQGGGLEVLDSDVGLWVMGGVLDIVGSPKRAWLRAAGHIPAGARTIALKIDPTGWEVGDEIAITPTHSPSDPNNYVVFDEARITAISGRTISLSTATSFAHPEVEVSPGRAFTPEVLNLSRNAIIQGTPQGRVHTFIHSTKRQRVKHAALRYMGPRHAVAGEDHTEKVLGRWGLHFHHGGHGSHGSVVNGVVVRDSGSHAFVPHASHGITFLGCVAYNNIETPYWWDEPTEDESSASNDIVFQSCVAARIEFDPTYRGGTRLMGFKMAQGNGNSARNCVAVGIGGQNNGDSSGFGWIADETGLWGFEDNVAHNNKNLGTRTWVNHPSPDVIRRYTAYHNGRFGSFNGAYGNSFDYIDSVYYANGQGAIDAKATSHEGKQRFSGLHVDQAGRSEYCMIFDEHVNDPPRPILIRDSSFKGHSKAALGFVNDTAIPDLVDVIDCDFEGNEFWLGPDIHPTSRIRVQDAQHGTIQLARWDQMLEGDLKPEWNARVKKIASFI